MAKTALSREEVMTELRKHKPELVRQFGVTELALVTVCTAPDDEATAALAI